MNGPLPNLRALICLAPIVMTAISGCDRPKPDVVTPPRAVSVLELKDSDPARQVRLPGSVAAWKQQKISFQVGGRVESVIAEDRDVFGPPIDENYKPTGNGQSIARMSIDRYKAALASATANKAAADALVEATRVQATDLIAQELETARIEQERAKSQLDRVKKAAESGAVAQQEVDNVSAAFNTANAGYQKVVARKTTLENELKVNQARVAQASEAINQAQLDLDDTELFAPFEGSITETHVNPGTVVTAGTPIATLTAMDPVKIEVTVSAARDRQIKTNDEVLVHTDATAEPIPAIVYQKSAVASSATRTFTLTLLCRNRLIKAAAKIEGADTATPIGGFMRPQQFEINGKQVWFVEERSIQTDESGNTHVWRVSNPKGGRAEDAVLDAEKVSVKLGAGRKELLGLFKFRELIPEGDLANALNDPTSAGRWKTVFAVGVPKDFSGGKVIKTTRRWLLRPGDIVDVQLELEAPDAGIYVPKRYVRVDGNDAYVFLIHDADGKKIAKRTPVKLEGSQGHLQQISGEGISPGVRMITSGAHYLQDGVEVEVFETQK